MMRAYNVIDADGHILEPLAEHLRRQGRERHSSLGLGP